MKFYCIALTPFFKKSFRLQRKRKLMYRVIFHFRVQHPPFLPLRRSFQASRSVWAHTNFRLFYFFVICTADRYAYRRHLAARNDSHFQRRHPSAVVVKMARIRRYRRSTYVVNRYRRAPGGRRKPSFKLQCWHAVNGSVHLTAIAPALCSVRVSFDKAEQSLPRSACGFKKQSYGLHKYIYDSFMLQPGFILHCFDADILYDIHSCQEDLLIVLQ